MRRMVMLLGLTMLIVMVTAGVGLAVVKTCKNVPCRGTDNDDTLYERIGNGDRDRILGLDGDDDMSAALYTNDEDRLDGGRQRDRILVNDNDSRDSARGGRGRDVCFIDQGDARRGCERVQTEAAGVEPAEFGSAATP